MTVVSEPLNLVYSHSRRIVSHIAPFHYSVIVVVNLIELEPFLRVPGSIVYSKKRIGERLRPGGNILLESFLRIGHVAVVEIPEPRTPQATLVVGSVDIYLVMAAGQHVQERNIASLGFHVNHELLLQLVAIDVLLGRLHEPATEIVPINAPKLCLRNVYLSCPVILAYVGPIGELNG